MSGVGAGGCSAYLRGLELVFEALALLGQLDAQLRHLLLVFRLRAGRPRPGSRREVACGWDVWKAEVQRVRLRGDNLLLGLVACLHHLHAGFVPSLEHSCECTLLRLPCGRCASTRIEQLLLRNAQDVARHPEFVLQATRCHSSCEGMR